MNFSKYKNVIITMIEPANIDNILNILGICDESKMHDTPANVIMKKMKIETKKNKNGTIVQ